MNPQIQHAIYSNLLANLSCNSGSNPPATQAANSPHNPTSNLPANPTANPAPLNQVMISESILQYHQDWKYCKSVANAVVPYGNYRERDLIPWQAKCIIELLLGNALLFGGSLICQNNNKITGGIRNSVNLFIHKGSMDWIRRDPSTRRLRQAGVEEVILGRKIQWGTNIFHAVDTFDTNEVDPEIVRLPSKYPQSLDIGGPLILCYYAIYIYLKDYVMVGKLSYIYV